MLAAIASAFLLSVIVYCMTTALVLTADIVADYRHAKQLYARATRTYREH